MNAIIVNIKNGEIEVINPYDLIPVIVRDYSDGVAKASDVQTDPDGEQYIERTF